MGPRARSCRPSAMSGGGIKTTRGVRERRSRRGAHHTSICLADIYLCSRILVLLNDTYESPTYGTVYAINLEFVHTERERERERVSVRDISLCAEYENVSAVVNHSLSRNGPIRLLPIHVFRKFVVFNEQREASNVSYTQLYTI